MVLLSRKATYALTSLLYIIVMVQVVEKSAVSSLTLISCEFAFGERRGYYIFKLFALSFFIRGRANAFICSMIIKARYCREKISLIWRERCWWKVLQRRRHLMAGCLE